MRTRRGLYLGSVAVLAVVTACTTPAEPLETPTLLTSATPACRVQIEYAIGRWMGAPVTLSTTVFMSDFSVLIEHKQARDASGRVLDGRLLERPELFRLVRSEGKCMIVNARTSERATVDARTSERATVDACTCRG